MFTCWTPLLSFFSFVPLFLSHSISAFAFKPLLLFSLSLYYSTCFTNTKFWIHLTVLDWQIKHSFSEKKIQAVLSVSKWSSNQLIMNYFKVVSDKNKVHYWFHKVVMNKNSMLKRWNENTITSAMEFIFITYSLSSTS